ncbi:ATP-dependent nuclease [Fulvivirga lutea]|uniref:AAA family ATPase n=1 Tax=Fulvivirga lutea TaxID=2810512 RepID=A0A974WK23_9BACT|nr:AAA family ATPase [Fulvivirga lutea]QSE98647.1 AAA family ATPase [Fulvivirga lutea]
MKLTQIEIEDFKSIKKLRWKLDQKMICLVGQNESGKSNLIEVLQFIKPSTIEDLRYEVHTRRSSDRYVHNELPLIKAIYHLDSEVKKDLEFKLKPHNPNGKSLSKFTSFVVESAQNEDEFSLNYFLSENDELDIRDIAQNQTQIDECIKIIEDKLTEIRILKDSELGTFTATLANIKSSVAAGTSLFKLMQLTDVRDFAKIPSAIPQLRNYLRGVNNRLNNRFVQKYYSQDPSVRFEIIHDSGSLYLEIHDNTDAQYTIEERSDGFKYFFGLLIEVATLGGRSNNVIFVLDEPGAKLHPSGQRDLLRYFEELSLNFGIIYTTHSPFLINRLYPNRVRVIEKNKTAGTLFKEKGFSKNWRPLRSALGLTLSDSFYYSDKALIVEGPEDIIYISALIDYYNQTNKVQVNTDLFSIIDAGGEGNLPAMVQIMIDEERPTTVLMDSDSQGTYNRIDKKKKGLKSGMLVVTQINDFKKDAVSIEDLLPSKLLVTAFNSCLKELKEEGSLKLVEDKNESIDEKRLTSFSRYKNDLAPFVKSNFSNPNKTDDEWERERVPISKVGIARHFEIHLNKCLAENVDIKSPESLRLIKTLIEKLGLKP